MRRTHRVVVTRGAGLAGIAPRQACKGNARAHHNTIADQDEGHTKKAAPVLPPLLLLESEIRPPDMEVLLSFAATLVRAAGPRGPVVNSLAWGRCCGGSSNHASFGGSGALPARGDSLAPGGPGKVQLRGRSPRKQRKSRKSRVTTGLPLGSTHSSTGISPIDLRGARMRFLPSGCREGL